MIIFLNTGEDLNQGWERLTEAYRKHDTRAYHIRDFENVLSPCLQKPLNDHENYKKIEKDYPLPTDDMRYIPDSSFRGRIRMFEMIMRENGIIGMSEKQENIEDNDILDTFFKGGKA